MRLPHAVISKFNFYFHSALFPPTHSNWLIADHPHRLLSLWRTDELLLLGVECMNVSTHVRTYPHIHSFTRLYSFSIIFDSIVAIIFNSQPTFFPLSRTCPLARPPSFFILHSYLPFTRSQSIVFLFTSQSNYHVFLPKLWKENRGRLF